MINKIKETVFGLLMAILVIALIAQLLGQPMLVYVDSESMEPTIMTNDGFIAVPSVIAGDVQEDDIIVFQSEELNDGNGGLTTHRVVSESDDGYITKGDNNPFNDQDNDEPPVTENRVRSVVLEVNGSPVTIPNLGLFVGSVSSIYTSILGLIGLDELSLINSVSLMAGASLLIYGVLGGEKSRDTSRSYLNYNRAKILIVVFVLIAILPMNYTMFMSSGQYQYEIISSDRPSDNPQIIEMGEKSPVTYRITNSGFAPSIIYIDAVSDGAEFSEEYVYIPARSEVNATIMTEAPEQTGNYYKTIQERRYVGILPPFILSPLHNIHPLVAIGALNLIVGSLSVLVSLGLVGTSRMRFRSKERGDESDIMDYIPFLKSE